MTTQDIVHLCDYIMLVMTNRSKLGAAVDNRALLRALGGRVLFATCIPRSLSLQQQPSLAPPPPRFICVDGCIHVSVCSSSRLSLTAGQAHMLCLHVGGVCREHGTNAGMTWHANKGLVLKEPCCKKCSLPVCSLQLSSSSSIFMIAGKSAMHKSKQNASQREQLVLHHFVSCCMPTNFPVVYLSLI